MASPGDHVVSRGKQFSLYVWACVVGEGLTTCTPRELRWTHEMFKFCLKLTHFVTGAGAVCLRDNGLQNNGSRICLGTQTDVLLYS